MRPNKFNLLILPASLLMAGLSSAATVTFDSVTLGSLGAINGSATDAPFTGTDGWSRSTSTGTGVIVTTTTSNEYVGGRALSADPTNGGFTYVGGKRGIIDTAVTSTISFDLRFETGISVTAGFLGDTDIDNLFDSGDTGMQFGANGNLVYARNAQFGSNVTLTGITNSSLTVGSWYGFDVTIGEVLSGNRSITMSVRNLTLGSTLDLNGASAGTNYTFSATAAEFGVAPEDAVGGFVRVTQNSTGAGRSAIDNLNFTAVPEPSSALLGGLGMLALLRRRRA